MVMVLGAAESMNTKMAVLKKSPTSSTIPTEKTMPRPNSAVSLDIILDRYVLGLIMGVWVRWFLEPVVERVASFDSVAMQILHRPQQMALPVPESFPSSIVRAFAGAAHG
jgi:hypothetical protein